MVENNEPAPLIELDEGTRELLNRAARLTSRTADSIVQDAARGYAREILVRWALDKHSSGELSFSELAERTGIPIEQLMREMQTRTTTDPLEAFIEQLRQTGNEEIVRTGIYEADQLRQADQENPL